MFQSLLGFLMRCDCRLDSVQRMVVLFQSLLGFLMRCDMGRVYVYSDTRIVSIPAGFSDALRQYLMRMRTPDIEVSIPAGFSDALRPSRRQTALTGIRVSIPAGFSDALRPNYPAYRQD